MVPLSPIEIRRRLQAAMVGDKVTIVWKCAAVDPDVEEEPCTWTGEVQRVWQENDDAVVVLWDAGLPRFEGRRRGLLPEDLNSFIYTEITFKRARVPARRNAPPTPVKDAQPNATVPPKLPPIAPRPLQPTNEETLDDELFDMFALSSKNSTQGSLPFAQTQIQQQTNGDGEQIDEIALGDRGVWKRAADGIKVPC